MALTDQLTSNNLPFLFSTILVILLFARWHRRSRFTKLNGPPLRGNFFLGYSKESLQIINHSHLFEKWAAQYGAAYHIPAFMGVKNLVLCDPKAMAHCFANDTFTYRMPHAARFFFEIFFRRNVLWAEGESHKRQRKAMSSAFSLGATRDLTPVFYDNAYLLKTSWDSRFQSVGANDAIEIEVQKWMNHYILDSVGKAGFAHDFGCLKNKALPVVAALDFFTSIKLTVPVMLTLTICSVFPFLLKLPNKHFKAIEELGDHVDQIACEMLEKARAEKNAGASSDRSILGILVRSESVDLSSRMSQEEIKSQVHSLVIAGYQTTATSLTWSLIELSRHPKEQAKLRAELAQFASNDPTFEQLTTGLPYLDAVVSESLRLHPITSSSTREVHADDVIPLSKPIRDANGELIDRVSVKKGTFVYVPIMSIQRSKDLWGNDAGEFKPGRWLDNSISHQRASEIQGYHHLLTFLDGPRTCLGKHFALTAFKVLLSTLIRNYTFELPDGPGTKIEHYMSALVRPMVAGQEGPNVPLVVRRVAE